MALSINCRICDTLTVTKFCRLIFGKSSTFKAEIEEVLGYEPQENDGLSKYVCRLCFNKLNKLSKIDFELKNKRVQLEKEKNDLLCLLRKNVNTLGKNTCTPQKNITDKNSFSTRKISKTPKRLLLPSPTPRKTKKIASSPKKAIPLTKTRLGLDISPGKAKVSFTGKKEKQVRTRIIKDGKWNSVIKSIVRGDSGLNVAKKLFCIDDIRVGLQKCFLKDLNNQCQTLCQTKTKFVLRNSSAKNLETLSLQTINEEVKIFAPLLSDVLSTVMNYPNNNRLAVATAILLNNRDLHMTALHHIVSQILDHGGATDESIKVLSSMGLGTGPQTESTKKGAFEVIQRTKPKNIVKDHVEQCQLQFKIDKSKKCLEALAADDAASKSEPLLTSQRVPLTGTATFSHTGIFNTSAYSSYTVAKSKQDHVVFSSNYSSSADVQVAAFLPAALILSQIVQKRFFPTCDSCI